MNKVEAERGILISAGIGEPTTELIDAIKGVVGEFKIDNIAVAPNPTISRAKAEEFIEGLPELIKEYQHGILLQHAHAEDALRSARIAAVMGRQFNPLFIVTVHGGPRSGVGSASPEAQYRFSNLYKI